MSAVTSFNQVQLRKDWGARHRDGFGPRDLPVTLWLHHTVTAHLSASATIAQEHAQMRTLEDIGQQRFGAGISYNWILFPSGRLYQGIGVRRRGAHTIGHNTTGMAVALAGNYQNTPMTENQIRTLAWFLPFAQSQGWIRQARFNGGHRDAPGNPTACPGNRAHAQLAEVHRRVASGPAPAAAPAAAPKPEPTPTPPASTPKEKIMAWTHRMKSGISNNTITAEAALRDAQLKAHQARDAARELRDRVWLRLRTSLVSGNQVSMSDCLAYTQLYAFGARSEAREIKAMIKALAKAQDEGHGKILEAVENAERDAIKVTAADLAKELEAETKLKVKE